MIFRVMFEMLTDPILKNKTQTSFPDKNGNDVGSEYLLSEGLFSFLGLSFKKDPSQ